MFFSVQDFFRDLRKIRNQNLRIFSMVGLHTIESSSSMVALLGVQLVFQYAEEEVEELLLSSDAIVSEASFLFLNRSQSVFLLPRYLGYLKSIPYVLDLEEISLSSARSNWLISIINHYPSSIILGSTKHIFSLIRSYQMFPEPSEDEVLSFTLKMSRAYNIIWVIRGSKYLIVDKSGIWVGYNNIPCYIFSLSSIHQVFSFYIAAFCAVNRSYLEACIHALALLSLSTEIASEKCAGPTYFIQAWGNSIYQSMDSSLIQEKLRIRPL